MREGRTEYLSKCPEVRLFRTGTAINVAQPICWQGWSMLSLRMLSQSQVTRKTSQIAILWQKVVERRVSGALDYKALMNEWQGGDRSAGNKLFSDLQRELELIAAAKLNGENNSSLSTGDLVNEAVIRLSRLKEIDLQGKAHILALASRIMRQVLVDQARKRNSRKRNHAKVTLVTNIGVWDRPKELLTLDWLLDELKDMDQERAEIVEMRFFGGMSIADIALVLEMSEATVKRRWVSTRAWLHDRLRD